MKGEELILRFFAFRYNRNQYEKPLQKFLNDFCEKHRDLDETTAKAWEEDFLNRDSPYEFLPTQKVCLGSISHAISLHLTAARSVIRSKKDQLAAIL